MDEQRAWLRLRRKRRLRTLAVILSVCVLFTSSPHIWETVSVFAAEESEGEGRQYIFGFAALSEEVREQSVPLGTELHELSLPDALEVYITVEDAENSGGGVETPGDSEGGDASADEETDDEGIESDDSEDVSEGNEPDGGKENKENEPDSGEEEPGDGNNKEESDGEEAGGDKESDNGDYSPEEEPDGSNDGKGNESDNEGAGNEENGPEVTEQSETGNADQAESDEAELKQETYTVTMPEYHAENVETAEVKTLIGGVTWDSTPAYDADTAGTYTFTAALPEGYTLAEGVSMPEIRVTVQDGSDDTAVQELLARIAALPEAEEILAKEPDAEDEEAYEEWTAELSVYGEEAFAILEAYEELTEEQQAQIPEEAAAKLMAWVELVEMFTGGQETYANNCGGEGYESAVTWTHDWRSGKLEIEGNGPMADYASASAATWVRINPAQVQSFTIGSGITHIGNNAFAGVKWAAVKSVTIPATVSSIGTRAFPQSGYLTAFIMEGTDVIPELGERCFSSDCTITIANCSYYDAYCNAPGWSAYKDNIRKRHKVEDRESISAKVPTCMETGNTAYWRCKSCGDLFADEDETIPTTLEAVTLPTNDNHSYTYSASGAVITESCANGCGHSATATLSVKSGADLTYTGSEIKPVIVTYSDNWGGTDKPGDTRISYTNNTNVDTATAKLTIGSATATVDFQITEADMTGVTASGYTGAYDGSAHGITVTVPADAMVKYGTASGSCTQNASPAYTNVGTYTVYYQVTKPNYKTVTGFAQVRINPRSISDAAVTLDSTALTYNGSAQTKGVSKVTVTADGKPLTLTAGTDYTISGNQGTDAKSYTMTLTGIGNYTDTKKVNFTIAAKPLTADMVTVAAGPHYYTGNAVTPAVTVKDGSCTLTADTDYTVGYNDNINVGTAKVTVTGKSNYTGTASQTFTIQYGSLPTGKELTDYVTVSPAPTDGWYDAEITLTPKSGCEVGETPSGIGSAGVTVSGETGTDGTTKTIYIKDEIGNIYQTEFPYKLDKTPPVINLSNMSVTNGTKGLWNWIIGKKSMIIHIPETDITDALSGIKEVTYTAVPDDGAQQTQTIRVKGGSYEISLNAEFSGIIKLTAQDKAGNSTEVSLTTAGGKVVAEDYAPVVTITLPDTPNPNENGWYNTTVSVDVTVTDDKNIDDTGILSGGIAAIMWKDGENGVEQTVTGLPGTSPVYKKEFTISVNTDGVHTYYVKAVDNAGNESGWQTVIVRLDISAPEFSRIPSVTNRTQEGADITFTPSEGGKAYWIVSDTGIAPDAQEVVAGAQGGAGNDGLKNVAEDRAEIFTITGLTPGESHTVYVVLEDAAGNLSEVKAVSFLTLQKAPEISLGNLVIDHEKETVKIPDGIGEVEVYTDPENPTGSKIRPDTDGSLPVEPGTTIYIRYPEKTQGSETTPASDSVTISIPGRPAAPSQKQLSVTDTTVTVTDPVRGEEYILVPKGSISAGQEPDWSGADETGAFTGLDPNQEYELWVRKKPTGNDFASEPSKTEVRTYVTVKQPVITGEGAGENGNIASRPTAPGMGGGTVPFTGTYGEEYTPVIKVGGREINPETTWDERAGKGTWEYPYPIPKDEDEIEITVEFRKRAVTAITVAPERLKIYADHAANRSAAEAGSMAPLTEWLKEECIPKAAYDNKTEGTVQGAVYTTTDRLVSKGSDYSYTVTAEGKTVGITLTVMPVNATVTAPPKVTQMQKSGGYTQVEVAAWLPAQVTVTYTGTGYTTRTESKPVTWNTTVIGADFGGTSGEETVSGTADLPDWATGQTDVSISIAFVDKQILTDAQMNLSVSGWIYGAQEKPVPSGSVGVADTNPVITYLYRADSGVLWTEAERLPRSGSGYIVPGAYQVKMTYTGDGYMGTKTAAFTVEKRPLTVEKGTLEAEDKNYDGTLTAALKEGGAPALTSVFTGDTVTAGGTLRAEFAEAGPKKDIAVTVTGFELEGQDAGYYVIGNTSITLQATINKADGTPPSDGKKPGTGDKDKDKDKDKETGGNVGEETGGSDDGTGNGDGTDNGGSSKPVVSPKNPEKSSDTPAPAETDRPAPEQKKPETGSNSGQEPKAQPTQEQTERQRNGKSGNAIVDTENKTGQGATVADNGGQSDSGTVRSVTATIDQGRIVVSGEKIPTGNVAGMEQASTTMALGNGAVFVTVVCEDEKYAAGVKDTEAVANAVLSAEQVQLVNDGKTIEIRVDVKDIFEKVPQKDKEVIENGLIRYREEVPSLTLGRYVDISMFMKIGESDWDAITSTEEPIEVVIGVPEDMREDGREFYIIRAHEGEHTFMRDLDEEPDTITISTDMFSSYAIAYVTVGSGNGGNVCGLCHICPTFLGVCCFIWLAAAIVVILFAAAVILRRKKGK